MAKQLPLNQILQGNSIALLRDLPQHSVDVIFADPPYNLRLRKALWRPNHTLVDAVDDEWDQIYDAEAANDYADYDAFTRAWLGAVRRVMKRKSSIWVSGSYHNIFRVGKIMQDMGFWILNTVVWYKPNAMPNFRGTRLKNDVEFLIWAKKSEKSKHRINYQLLKRFNDGKQLGAFWTISTCVGPERLTDTEGKKLHSTQKPFELLKRVLLASSYPDAVVLDPFSGTGTTAAAAKHLHMNYIGIERDPLYIAPSRKRAAEQSQLPTTDPLLRDLAMSNAPRVHFRELIRSGYLDVGQTLYLDRSDDRARILHDGKLQHNGQEWTIHSLSRRLRGTRTSNGWTSWRYRDGETGELLLIDNLRESYRLEHFDLSL